MWKRDERGRDRLTMAGAAGVWERDERGRDRLTMAGAVECGREMREVGID